MAGESSANADSGKGRELLNWDGIAGLHGFAVSGLFGQDLTGQAGLVRKVPGWGLEP